MSARPPSSASPSDIPLAPGVRVPSGEVRFAFSRSSGPGGQAVNKLATKAELRVSVEAIIGLDDTAQSRLRRLAGKRLTLEDEIVIQSDVSRSQRMNRNDCLERLRELVLRAATPPKKRKKTKPTKAAKERRLQEKRERSEKKRRRAEGNHG